MWNTENATFANAVYRYKKLYGQIKIYVWFWWHAKKKLGKYVFFSLSLFFFYKCKTAVCTLARYAYPAMIHPFLECNRQFELLKKMFVFEYRWGHTLPYIILSSNWMNNVCMPLLDYFKDATKIWSSHFNESCLLWKKFQILLIGFFTT